MNCVKQLPQGYGERAKIDLQKNKKEALLVNGVALVIMLILAAVGSLFVPLTEWFSMEWYKIVTLVVGILLYLVLHELVHAVFMKYYGAQKVKFGYTGLYAYAGCGEYFGKKAYIVIALAPVMVWGIVLLILNLLAGNEWFWVIYSIQICNLSGAAGDLYVTAKLSKMPADILILDSGVSMVVYQQLSTGLTKECGKDKEF